VEKAIASRAVAMIAQIVAIDRVTAEQGIVVFYSGTVSKSALFRIYFEIYPPKNHYSCYSSSICDLLRLLLLLLLPQLDSSAASSLTATTAAAQIHS